MGLRVGRQSLQSGKVIHAKCLVFMKSYLVISTFS